MIEIGFFPILVVALSLSADCFAVALGGNLSSRVPRLRLVARVALSFGLFQGGMTAIGWLAGSTIAGYISSYDHWVAFIMLAFIGGKIVRDSLRRKTPSGLGAGIGGWVGLLVLSVATSLDALAVGLSLALLSVNIIVAVLTIGLVAMVVTAIGFIAGRRLGALVGRWAETIGGVILVIIGIIIIVEHLI